MYLAKVGVQLALVDVDAFGVFVSSSGAVRSGFAHHPHRASSAVGHWVTLLTRRAPSRTKLVSGAAALRLEGGERVVGLALAGASVGAWHHFVPTCSFAIVHATRSARHTGLIKHPSVITKACVAILLVETKSGH